MKRFIKLIGLLLVVLFISIPLVAHSQQVSINASKLQFADRGSNTELTVTMTAPTANRYMLVSCIILQAKTNTSAPSAGMIRFYTTGLQDELEFYLPVVATANTVSNFQLCPTQPLRAASRQTAISVNGNSGDANVMLYITLTGYEGL